MRAVLPIFIFCFLFLHADAREWIDIQSRMVEASLVRVDGANVVLKLTTNREVTIPLANLSSADQVYVKTQNAMLRQDAIFSQQWPDLVSYTEDLEIATIEENAENKSFIYESAHYRYTSDVRLGKSVVKGFAVLFEATLKYCRSIPLGLDVEPSTGKFSIMLYEDYEQYLAAGAMQGSAGVYIPSRKCVLVPLQSLGVKKMGSGYLLDRDKSSITLPHELTHQVTPEIILGQDSLSWFYEGLADSIACTPYRSGIYKVRMAMPSVISYVTTYGDKGKSGRNLGNKIHVRPLKEFMHLPYAVFFADTQRSYGFALLLTTYFLHLDGNGDSERMKNFVKELRSGKSLDESYKALLDGRTYEELEKQVVKAWKSKGIEISIDH